jgi:CRISPR/Cas system-associated exonuclease Cas4 (RecB family)
MNMATKNDIVEQYVKEYLKASKERKSEILDIVTEVTKLHRKSVTRRFRKVQLKDPAHEEKRGRPMNYLGLKARGITGEIT